MVSEEFLRVSWLLKITINKLEAMGIRFCVTYHLGRATVEIPLTRALYSALPTSMREIRERGIETMGQKQV